MIRLLRAIFYLGPLLGFHYWRMENRCAKNPELLKDWSNALRRIAQERYNQDTADDVMRREVLLSFADELDLRYKPKSSLSSDFNEACQARRG